MDAILSVILSYLINLASNERTDAIHKNHEATLAKALEKREKQLDAMGSGRSLREELRSACIELARKHDTICVSPLERSLWCLLSDDIFQNDLTEWLMAGGIEEGVEVKNRLLKSMEATLAKSGASEDQITFLRTSYFESLEKAIFKHPFLAHWRHQLSLDYLREQVEALRCYAENAAGVYPPAKQKTALDRYCEKALGTWDIIDLSNLPEGDIHMVTQKFLLRQLYMPLRVKLEPNNRTEGYGDFIDRLEEQREALRHREAGHFFPDESDEPNRPEAHSPVGERMSSSHRLVVLGDPGSGKTTMLRWMATAYLLRNNDVNAFSQIPDAQTLPDRSWIPVLIRCRDLGDTDLCRCFSDFLTQHLHKTELLPEEAEVMHAVILDHIARGEALLLVDGLDEITNPQVRMMFCQELERTATRYPDSYIVVTSRIVGYRDMPYRMGSGFRHGIIAELNRADKDLFAQRWIEVTEQHQPITEKIKRTQELIEALHSSDRIERLTGNPMLLTTLALVKRKVGKLPNRRNKLYSEAVSVLLNWNPRLYRTIEEDEAIPQLEYLAYEMCRRGVQRLTNDDVLDLLDRLRAEYPNVRAIRRQEPQAFLELLEARSSILIKSGSIWQKSMTQEKSVWEFRHLSFQEYLAARALLDGKYPGRDKTKSLAEQVASLAGAVEVSQHRSPNPDPVSEVELTEAWREALRLLVADCNDDDVDDVLIAILNPIAGEDEGETGRPRTSLAVLCLVDEPNVSEETAQQVIIEFAKKVNTQDGSGIKITSFDSAATEIGGGMWAPLFKKILIEEFFQRTPKMRSCVGWIWGMAELKRWGDYGLDSLAICAELVQHLQAEDRNEVISATLTVTEAAYERKAVVLPGLIKSLFGLLNRGPAECHAAGLALLWLNDGNRRQPDRRPLWLPTMDELAILIASLEQAPPEEEDFRNYLRTIIANIAYENGEEVVTPILMINLASTNADVRRAVVMALGNLGNPETVKTMLSLLNDPDAHVQRSSIAALGKLGDPRAVEPLLSRLKDSDVGAQRAAVEALGNIKDSRAVEPLLSLLNDPDSHVQFSSIVALGKLGDPRAVEPIITCLKSSDVEVQRAAIYALGKLGGPRAAESLITCLKSGDVEVQDDVVYALGNIKDLQSVEPLITCLKSGKAEVQRAAVYALMNVQDPRIVAPLIALLKDDNVRIQACAKKILNEVAKRYCVNGEVNQAIEVFKVLHQQQSDTEIINNLLYCYIILKRYEEASALNNLLDCSKENKLSPILQHNRGILEFIMGHVKRAEAYLRTALESIREQGFDHEEAMCMLLLDGHGHATSEIELPIEAACLLNLHQSGAMSFDEVSQKLYNRFPDKHLDLIAKIDNRR